MNKFESVIIVLLFIILVDMLMVSFQLYTMLENQRYLVEMIEVIYDQNS